MAGPDTFIIPSSPLDRRRLGKYEVLCRLSTGGMSQIYLAQQQGMAGFHKLVVLKTILPDIVGEEDFVRMFLDEARTTAGFNHPHIAQVYELDTSDDVLFMAMEFVQGCTLVELARACRQAREPIPIGITLQAVRDTALALHYAHTFVDARGRRQQVIHRDVAEKNIMVTYEGVTKLLDFGIAKAQGKNSRTSAGMVKGTSGYMSPEQIRGEPLDPRSDLFSLGVVLHECLTGLRLFHGKNAEEGMMAALRGTVAPPSRWNALVSPEVDAVAMKALSKDRDGRFGTALEMARAIDRAAAGAIWHPEQSGELVQRHFAARRAETRRVLEAAFTADAQAAAAARAEAVRKASGPDPARLWQQAATTQPATPADLSALAAVRARSVPTPPPLPSSRTPPPVAVPPAPPARLELDASEAKTIPAAALPEEIKAIRARMVAEEARRAAEAAPPRASAPRASGVQLVLPRSGDTNPDSPRARAQAAPAAPPAEPEETLAGRPTSGRWIWAFVVVGLLVSAGMAVWLWLDR